MGLKKDKPEVSVIIPNLNGKKHLERCLSTLQEINYNQKKIEYILVDNGSVDDSVRFINYRFPFVRIIANGQNLGFCMACNLGAKAAQGEILVFLNNDMRVDKEWLNPLVDVIQSEKADCASSLILSWDGKVVNFGGAGANFHGIGFQQGMDDPDLSKYQTQKETLFACGGSMAIKRQLFMDTLGFDENFFAYFEDVDYGWRLWVLGHKVLFVPQSVAYHHHSATSKLMDIHKLRVLHIRNPLYAIFKNYEYDNLLKILPAALLLTLKRTMYLTGLSDRDYRFNGHETFLKGSLGEGLIKGKAKLSQAKVPRTGLADLIAINDFSVNFKGMMLSRDWVQERRKRPDSEILPMFGDPFWAVEPNEEFEETLNLFADFFDFSKIFEKK